MEAANDYVGSDGVSTWEDLVFLSVLMVNALVWGVLIFLPIYRFTLALVRSLLIPVLYTCILMIVMLTTIWETKNSSTSSWSLQGVAVSSQKDTLIMWLSSQIMNLFFGGWQLQNSREINLPHILVIPCLLLTYFKGPIGLFSYFLVRLVFKRTMMTEFHPLEESVSPVHIWFGEKSFWSGQCTGKKSGNAGGRFEPLRQNSKSKFSIADLELDSEDVDRELIDEVEGKTHKENSTPTQQESSNGKQELTFSL